MNTMHNIPEDKNDSQGFDLQLGNILQVLIQHKWILAGSICTMLALAGIYNLLARPLYQASILIKKDKPGKELTQDDFDKIVQRHSKDALETEMELVKTRDVLQRVVTRLGLHLKVSKIVSPSGSEANLDLNSIELAERLAADSSAKLPPFSISHIETDNSFQAQTLRLLVADHGVLNIYNEADQLLQVVRNDSMTHCYIDGLRFMVDCRQLPLGTSLYVEANDVDLVAADVLKTIIVTSFRNTHLFRVLVNHPSPLMAQTIANELAESFRLVRLEQERQNIRYSYQFVDSQLQDITRNLRDAEARLGRYRSENQIVAVDQSSQEIMQFLSNLEAERIEADLELSEYKHRYQALLSEIRKKGFIDQTHLTPTLAERNNSPFSVLMTQLSDAELEKLRLMEKRLPDHPEVKAITRRIAEIKDKLSFYNQNTLTAYRVFIESAKTRRQALQKLIARYEARMKNLPAFESQLLALTRARNVYEKMYVMLLDKREEMRIAELSRLQDISIVETAALPIKPIAPRRLFNMLLALIAGTMIGLVTIFWLEFNSPTIRNLADVEKLLNTPILAILPEFPKGVRERIEADFSMTNHLPVLTDAQHGFRESYRVMRTKLPYHTNGANTLMITSCEENTGKTTVITNFALSLAMTGKKVMLIDCDFNKPKIGAFFSLPPAAPGLITFLKGLSHTPTVYDPFRILKNEAALLHVIPAGGYSENSGDLLDSTKFKSLIRQLSSYYDYVLLDTPPMTHTADTFILGRFLKNVVLVVRPDLTVKESLIWANQNLAELNMRIAGCVINGCNQKRVPGPYRYGYGYSEAVIREILNTSKQQEA